MVVILLFSCVSIAGFDVAVNVTQPPPKGKAGKRTSLSRLSRLSGPQDPDLRLKGTAVRFKLNYRSQGSHRTLSSIKTVIPAKRSASRDPGFPPFSGSRIKSGMTMGCVANSVRRWQIPFASTVSLSGIVI
jgi:hypothetical protein